MLILSRRLGESVKIGCEVTVTVLGVKGGHVRLGFAAPKHVAVHREEIYERLQRAGDIGQAGSGKFFSAALQRRITT